MVDCGEGTQAQIRRSRLSFTKLYAVFISHLHGDHVLGLIGMISTFGLQGRTAPLHVYAPAAYSQLLQMELDMFCSTLDYEIIFHPVDTTKQQIIYEDRSLTVETIPLHHRMPCSGFIFREKPGQRHIKPDMLNFYNIPQSQINNLRAGMDWTSPSGEIIPNNILTTPPDPVRAYAYCSDTRYMPSLKKLLHDVTTLYHEATYCEDMKDKAVKYLHSTAREAAMTARDANVNQLIIGHFSQRYLDETPLKEEAQAIFPNTVLANENHTYDV
uniref:Ribonuclease Z n=1 Tax=uncultured Prevotella sp. TaxID=159272 RepID=A0A6G8F278_9BACT|nr:ribonuclease Z [uncultured Prevotella sp.]